MQPLISDVSSSSIKFQLVNLGQNLQKLSGFKKKSAEFSL